MEKLAIISTLIVAIFSVALAQETLDANDPASYVFGGGQKSNTATVNLLEVHLIDLEPEGNGVLVFGGSQNGLSEAGAPAVGGGTLTNQETWINYSYRGVKGASANIQAVCNQSLPAGMSLKVEIIGTGPGTSFNASITPGNISLSTIPTTLMTVSSGYTSDGVNQGFHLKYVIENPNNASLPPGFEVVFTLQ